MKERFVWQRYVIGCVASISSFAGLTYAGAEGTTNWRDPNTGYVWYYAGHKDYDTGSVICGAVPGRLPSVQEVTTAIADGMTSSNNTDFGPNGRINILQSGSQGLWTQLNDPNASTAIAVLIDQSISPSPRSVQHHVVCITSGGGSFPPTPPSGGGDSCSRYSSYSSCLDYDGGNGPYARGCRWSNTAGVCYNNRNYECTYYSRMGYAACLDYDGGSGPYARGCRWDNGDNSCKHE